MGACHGLRVASRSSSRKAAVAATQDLFDGEYALIIYATSFANKAEGHETLTLERESNGKWRSVGYFIR